MGRLGRLRPWKGCFCGFGGPGMSPLALAGIEGAQKVGVCFAVLHPFVRARFRGMEVGGWLRRTEDVGSSLRSGVGGVLLSGGWGGGQHFGAGVRQPPWAQ